MKISNFNMIAEKEDVLRGKVFYATVTVETGRWFKKRTTETIYRPQYSGYWRLINDGEWLMGDREVEKLEEAWRAAKLLEESK